MRDLQDSRLLYLKAALLLLTGFLACTVILLENPSLKTAALLALAVWAFARAYYFAFYVVQHYADPDYRFAGLWSFARYLISTRKEAPPPPPPDAG